MTVHWTHCAVALAIALGALGGTEASGAEPERDSAILTGHSHNDYEQAHPLFDALSNGFHSVEADVWFSGGRLQVSHVGNHFKGTLEELYLDPLQTLVTRNGGSVYGDGKEFFLWIDLKGSQPFTVPYLYSALRKYPMLTVFTDSEVRKGAVTVILTGTYSLKAGYVNRYSERHAVRDDNGYSPAHPNADNRWQWYALEWGDYIHWCGIGAFPKKQRAKLETLVNTAHALGRKVRFYAIPESAKVWTELVKARVDFIGGDNLPKLREFLDSIP